MQLSDHFRTAFFAAALAMVSFPAAAQSGEWQRITPDSLGRVFSVAYAYENEERVLYAPLVYGLYKSYDEGQSWQLLFDPIPPNTHGWSIRYPYMITSIAVSQTDPHRVYAAAQNAVYRSDDAGYTWERISENMPQNMQTFQGFHQVAVSPFDSDMVYVGTSSSASFFAASQDGGETWYGRELAFGSHPGEVLVAVSPVTPGKIFVSAVNNGLWPYEWLLLSHDHGRTLRLQAEHIAPRGAWDFHMDAYDRLYVGYLVSTDDGGHWNDVFFNDKPYKILRIDPGGSVMCAWQTPDDYHIDYSSLWVSYDTAETWQEISESFPNTLSYSIVAIDGRDSTLFAATWSGLLANMSNSAQSTSTENPAINFQDLLVEGFPNPSAGKTTIRAKFNGNADVVEVFIHDVLGRRLAVLKPNLVMGETWEFQWDGSEDGRILGPGLYLATVVARDSRSGVYFHRSISVVRTK